MGILSEKSQKGLISLNLAMIQQRHIAHSSSPGGVSVAGISGHGPPFQRSHVSINSSVKNPSDVLLSSNETV